MCLLIQIKKLAVYHVTITLNEYYLTLKNLTFEVLLSKVTTSPD